MILDLDSVVLAQELDERLKTHPCPDNAIYSVKGKLYSFNDFRNALHGNPPERNPNLLQDYFAGVIQVAVGTFIFNNLP